MNRLAGWAGIVSGISGLVAVYFLLAYLGSASATTRQEWLADGAVGTPPGVFAFQTVNYVGVLLQALFMIPVAVTLRQLDKLHQGLSRLAATVGIVALGAIVMLRLLVLTLGNRAVPDLLFLGPTGFVGIWLVFVNWLLTPVLPKKARVLGTIAGIGLAIAGASFFFLGGLTVLTEGPYAVAGDVDFHAGLYIGGFPGFILYSIWAILVGRRLLRAPG
jgi:hypothetical protein